MRQFSGYDEAKKNAQFTGSAQLPTGAYVCDIKDVNLISYTWGDVLVVSFDVTEGENKDFFANQYKNNQSEDKKWKGTTRINVPTDDGSEKDGWTKDNFVRWTDALEKSNSGYVWDWDENKWKGKKIGIVFGKTGTVIDGKEIEYTEAHGCCSVDDVKNDTFYKKLLDLRAKNGYTGTKNNNSASHNTNTDFVSIPDGVEEELPFN